MPLALKLNARLTPERQHEPQLVHHQRRGRHQGRTPKRPNPHATVTTNEHRPGTITPSGHEPPIATEPSLEHPTSSHRNKTKSYSYDMFGHDSSLSARVSQPSRPKRSVVSRSPLRVLPVLLAIVCLLAGCGGSAGSGAGGSSGQLHVVAAENFWGSVASQLGGSKVQVQSIIVNPSTDPHSYEPTASDGVALARSQMAIVNGIGYDAWASKLIDANPSGSRAVLNVGDLLGLKEADNPHQWYSPSSVKRVIDQLVADYKRLDPKDAAYFDHQRTVFETQGLSDYNRLIAAIRSRYAGVPVGYSESIFQLLGQALGLKLMTPYSFAKAIAEGTDVSAADKQTVDAQAQGRQIKVWVYNSQNATPDVQRVNQLARAAHIPITTITETLSPASATFEQWQAAELRSLQQALHQATGR